MSTEEESKKNILAELKKQSDGTNIIKEYKDIFSKTNGSDLKTDLITEDLTEALALLKKSIDEKKQSAKKEKHRVKWNFEASPHEAFGKTLDDTFTAFLSWARVKQDHSKINVSKAFRRLESYADWMGDTGTDLTEPALTTSSVQNVLEAWAFNSSYNEEGQFIWWCDMARADFQKIKKEFTPEQNLRAFVWYTHAVMYDENAQKNGMCFVYNVNKLGMVESFTLMPAKLSTKIDRLTIGVLPVRMKGMYMWEIPAWVNIFFALIGVFMSKKMKKRIILSKDWSDLEKMFGLEAIPKNFGKVEGKLETDVIEKKYFSV